MSGSLIDKTLRIEMENSIFRKLQDAIELQCRSKDWFGMAEQAINTIYALGEHPDVLCNELIRNLTRRAFSPRETADGAIPPKDPDAMNEDPELGPSQAGDMSMDSEMHDGTQKTGSTDKGDAFELSQLLFVVGHVAIKHIAYLELVEREWKRQKDEHATRKRQAISSKAANMWIAVTKAAADKDGAGAASKDGEELDQVAGNAEDDIGDRIAGVRETELLYGPESLLALYGPMLVHICGSPHKFKVCRHPSRIFFR